MIWLLLLLIVLIATGAIWLVLKVALGVALGLLLVIAVLAAFAWWRFRKAMNAGSSWSPRPGGQGSPSNGDEGPGEGGTGSSQITVFYEKNPPPT
jgi:hypothetical protein